uniref:Putative secreted protein n=1 Tax=Ixodes ricinus TaxID=34613 RepID=V5H853_IXORI
MKATVVAIFFLAAVTYSMGESWGKPTPCPGGPGEPCKGSHSPGGNESAPSPGPTRSPTRSPLAPGAQS